MRSVTTLSEHVSLQADQEQVLCRELVCVCDELQSCCEHAASAVTVHPQVQTLLLTRQSALLQAGTTSEWMCGENIEQQMQQERRAILELPFVSGISDAAHGKRGGFRVNLRCHTAQEHGNCECGGVKQGVPVLVSSTRTTLLECLQEVHNQVLRQHGPQCVAASKSLQAERIAQAASQDALRTMMYFSRAQQCLTKATAELNNIKQRADKVHKEALELEKAVDITAKTVHAAEKEVQELQAQLNPKRARIEADVEEEDEIENVGDWTQPDHHCEASRVQKRRDDVLGSRDTKLNCRTGSTGYLQYPVWDSLDGCHIGHEVI